MKLFFKKLLIFIVVTLIFTMEIDATNIVTQYCKQYECVNARSINTTKVKNDVDKFRLVRERGYKMGDSIRIENIPRLRNVKDTTDIRRLNLYALY